MFQLHVAALVSHRTGLVSHRTGLCHTDQFQGVLDSGSCSYLMSSESNVGQTQGYLDNWRVKSSNFSAVISEPRNWKDIGKVLLRDTLESESGKQESYNERRNKNS